MGISTLLATVGSVLAGGVVATVTVVGLVNQQTSPGANPTDVTQAGHDRLRQQRLTPRPCPEPDLEVALLGILAVHPSMGQHLVHHDGERLLGMLPGERMAHLAGALGQVAAPRARRAGPRRARRSAPRGRPRGAPRRRPRSTRGCRRRSGRRRSGCRACRPRRRRGPSPPSVTAGPAPRPARRPRACAPRRRDPRRPRCRRRRAAAAYACRLPSHQPLPTTCSRRSGELAAQRDRSVDGVLDLLVRDQPADHGDHRGARTSRRSTGRAGRCRCGRRRRAGR